MRAPAMKICWSALDGTSRPGKYSAARAETLPASGANNSGVSTATMRLGLMEPPRGWEGAGWPSDALRRRARASSPLGVNCLQPMGERQRLRHWRRTGRPGERGPIAPVHCRRCRSRLASPGTPCGKHGHPLGKEETWMDLRRHGRGRRIPIAVVAGVALLALPGQALARDGREVRITDRCDAATFPAAAGCIRNSEVTFAEFLEKLNPAD